jgi:DNA-binding protein H-NS
VADRERQEEQRRVFDRLFDAAFGRRETNLAKKYQKGDLAWSGSGTQPAWIEQHLALGGTLKELEAPL